MDGGGGSDANFRLLLEQGYHIHAKGLSHSRAAALAKSVSRWDAYANIWLGEVAPTFDLGRPIRVFVQCRCKKGRFYILISYLLNISGKRIIYGGVGA